MARHEPQVDELHGKILSEFKRFVDFLQEAEEEEDDDDDDDEDEDEDDEDEEE